MIARHDYDQAISDWLSRSDRDPSLRPQDDIGFLRSGMQATFVDAGMSESEITEQMALFDEAALRIFQTSNLNKQETKKQKEASVTTPLGWLWLVSIWISCGIGLGVFGWIYLLLMPLVDYGRMTIGEISLFALLPSTFVFGAALLLVSKLIKEYRELGLLLFWTPMILGCTLFNIVIFSLVPLLTQNLSADYLPLAIPLALFVSSALCMFALWIFWRHWRKPTQTFNVQWLFELILGAFSCLFFSIGAQTVLEWGSGPSLVAGLFSAAMILRLFRDKEIIWWSIPVLALPLMLLAAEMPPSGLAALTILVLAWFVAISIMLIVRLRYTTLYSATASAALSLLLLIIPGAPGLWLSEQSGRPLKQPAEIIMKVYDHAYQTELGQALIGAVTGLRSRSAHGTVIEWLPQKNNHKLTLKIDNRGEKGIKELQFMLTLSCGELKFNHTLSSPLWPQESVQIKLPVELPANCKNQSVTELESTLVSTLGKSLRTQVMVVENIDAKQRFREDARAWLGLK